MHWLTIFSFFQDPVGSENAATSCFLHLERRPQVASCVSEVRANLTLDPHYRDFRKLKAAKSKQRGALGGSGISPETQHNIKAAMALAEVAGRPITKLTVKIIWDIQVIQDKLSQ
jgi:hypothetical protein